MKIKNITIKFIALVLTLNFISCNDFLDEKPKTVIDTDNFYNNYNDFNTALNGALSLISKKEAWGRNMFLIMNGGNDEIVMRDEKVGQLGMFLYSPDDCQTFEEIYTQFNRAIFSLNNIINRLNEIQLSKEEKDYLLSQSLFLRAYCRLELSTVFGAILITNDSNPKNETPRSSIKEVFKDNIIPDMEWALKIAPENASLVNNNAIDKYVIKSFLAWTYNYLATAKIQGMGKSSWGTCPLNSFEWVNDKEYHFKALSYTNDIIKDVENGTYKKELIPCYGNLFRELNKEDQQKEFMWTGLTTVENGGDLVHSMIDFGMPYGRREVGGGFGKYQPTLEMYNKYDVNDIRRNHNITGGLDEDKNNRETVNKNVYYSTLPVTQNKNSKIYTSKYRILDPSTTIRSSWADNCIDIAYMRLAEVYLMNAEAQYFYDGNIKKARAALYPIRLRAAGGNTEKADILTEKYKNSDFIWELLDERSREFFSEGKRKLDLFRFGSDAYVKAIESIKNDYDKDVPNSSFNSHIEYTKRNYEAHPDRIWGPIPIIEKSVNTLLDQNPGY